VSRYFLVAFLILAPPALAQDQGLAAWSKFYDVLSHPRCANCHVGADNLPIWSDPPAPRPRPHGMNINAGESRIGSETLPCDTCHNRHNAELPHGPPGAPNWRLAPVEMQWSGKTSAEVCAQIKDSSRNGNRSVGAIADHVANDSLVAWGWAPGAGRASAPYSAAETASYLRQWEAAGTPCPAK
jgi:hypothetical protein